MRILREKLGLTQDELDDLLEKAFTAVDGLWFLGVEEAAGFETAMAIDIRVWARFAETVARRLKKMWGIENPTREQALRIVDIIYALGHLEVETRQEAPGRYLAEAPSCPWWENLRRAGREKIVRCHEVDQEMFAAALRAVDPGLRLEWIASRPQGATTCRWRIHAAGC
ncbi:MAG TPA: DUF6125 family protein [Candidatus Methylomirabilis sp.]